MISGLSIQLQAVTTVRFVDIEQTDLWYSVSGMFLYHVQQWSCSIQTSMGLLACLYDWTCEMTQIRLLEE